MYNILAPTKASLFEEKTAVFQKNRRVANVPKRNRDKMLTNYIKICFIVANVPKRNRDFIDQDGTDLHEFVANVPKRNRD